MSKASGRMIRVDISVSNKVACLSEKAFSLFCLLIPHFNAHGKMQANDCTIKGTVCPLIEWIHVDEIRSLLLEISEHTNVKYWTDEKGISYLQSLNWTKHQNLRSDRLGTDSLPNYPMSCPGVVLREVEEEVKGEIEVDIENKPSAQAEGGSLKGETPDIDPVILDGQARLVQKRQGAHRKPFIFESRSEDTMLDSLDH